MSLVSFEYSTYSPAYFHCSLLQGLNLPGSLQALEKPLGLPLTLVSHAEEVRQQDGLNLLQRSLGDIAKIKAGDKAAYTEGVSLLSAEKEEDDGARVKYGTDRWSRESSEVAAQTIYKTAGEIDEYFISAQKSDDLIEKKLKDSEQVLTVLSGSNRDLESYVPSSLRAAITPEVERESSRLRSCLNEVSRLENRRKRRIQALKDKARSDDISKFKYTFRLLGSSISYTRVLDPALLKETARLEREYPMQPIEASQFENLFEDHLRLYDTDLETITQERNDQNETVTQVREANRIFIKARQGDSSTKEREEALQDLENGYLRYKETISNIDMARRFYNDLAKMLGRFRDDCKAFVQQRRLEASQLEMYALPGFRLSPSKTNDGLLKISDITNAAAMASLDISQHQRHSSHQQQANCPLPYGEFQNPSQFQSPAIPQPQLQTHHAEPLTAPQPTRATVAPPVATRGVWSPDMGIRFGNAAAPSQGPGLGRGQAQETWDPNRGVRFS